MHRGPLDSILTETGALGGSMKRSSLTGRDPVRFVFPFTVALAAVAVILAAAAVQVGADLEKATAETEQLLSGRATALARSAVSGGRPAAILDTLSLDASGMIVLSLAAGHQAGSGLESALVYVLPPGTVDFPGGTRVDPLAMDAFMAGTSLSRREGDILSSAVIECPGADSPAAVAVASARIPLSQIALDRFRRESIPGLFILSLALVTPVIFLLYISFFTRRRELDSFELYAPNAPADTPSARPEPQEAFRILAGAVKSSRGTAGMILMDGSAVMKALNESAANLFDGRPEDFMGQSMRTLPCFGPAERAALRPDPGEWSTMSLPLKVDQATGPPRYLRISVTPAGADPGGPAWLAILTDVTEAENLKKEKERLMEREMAVNSYAILAAMVRGFSHDLSNLLSSIIGAASLGEAVHDPGNPDRQRYEAILNATERASAISEELFHSAGLTESRAVPLDPVRELEETTEALRSVLPRSISLEVNLKGVLPSVIADRSLFRQTIYNMALRSSGALQGSGRIKLWVEDVPDPSSDPRFAGQCRNLCGIHCVSICISDGTLLPVGLQRSLSTSESDPYEIEKLYGAGMAAVQQAVRVMKGVLVFSPDQRGTVIRMLLPAAQRMADTLAQAASRSNISVLIAESEIIVRETAARILQHFGFRAVEASSGEEALAVLDHESFDLLILDLGTFAGPSLDVAMVCSERWPSMAVLFTSGYEIPTDVSSFLKSRPGAGFLRKPYPPESISSEITRLVASMRPSGQS